MVAPRVPRLARPADHNQGQAGWTERRQEPARRLRWAVGWRTPHGTETSRALLAVPAMGQTRQEPPREPDRDCPDPRCRCRACQLEPVQQAGVGDRCGLLHLADVRRRRGALRTGDRRGRGHRSAPPDLALLGVPGGNWRPAGWLFPLPADRLPAGRPVARLPDRARHRGAARRAGRHRHPRRAAGAGDHRRDRVHRGGHHRHRDSGPACGRQPRRAGRPARRRCCARPHRHARPRCHTSHRQPRPCTPARCPPAAPARRALAPASGAMRPTRAA